MVVTAGGAEIGCAPGAAGLAGIFLGAAAAVADTTEAGRQGRPVAAEIVGGFEGAARRRGTGIVIDGSVETYPRTNQLDRKSADRQTERLAASSTMRCWAVKCCRGTMCSELHLSAPRIVIDWRRSSGLRAQRGALFCRTSDGCSYFLISLRNVIVYGYIVTRCCPDC